MNTYEQQAKDSLAQLVNYVCQCENGLIKGITYQELAVRIGRVDKYGQGHAHGMGLVLGMTGHLIQNLEDAWGEPIPHIQSLVVKKTGRNRGLPDDGIKEFWPYYPLMTLAEKTNRTRVEHQKVMTFGSRWNDVLAELNIQSVTPLSPSKPFGKGGESFAHKALKKYVRQHPEVVGAKSDWTAIEEYPLPSLDQIDVLFKCHDACIAVEVKSQLSDSYPADYERGLYQTIKYHALLTAMANDDQYEIPTNIRSVLVLESRLPLEYEKTSEILGIEIVPGVKVIE